MTPDFLPRELEPVTPADDENSVLEQGTNIDEESRIRVSMSDAQRCNANQSKRDSHTNS